MLKRLKNILTTTADNLGVAFTCLDTGELEKYVHVSPVTIDKPLVNLDPIEGFSSDIRVSSVLDYEIPTRIYFLANFVKPNDIETVKDEALDAMIELSGKFFRNITLDGDRSFFRNTEWGAENTFVRNITSHLLLGVKSEITFTTACNRF